MLNSNAYEYLSNLNIQNLNGRLKHKNNDSLSYIQAKEANIVLGDDYLKILSRFGIEIVDHSFKLSKVQEKQSGFTKGWIIPTDLGSRIESEKVFKVQAKKSCLVLKEKVLFSSLNDCVEGKLNLSNKELQDAKSQLAHFEKFGTVEGDFYVREVKYKQHGNSGRRFAISPSLQHSTKNLRNILLNGSGFYDIDINNCHPTILLQLLEKAGKDISLFQTLKKYISNASEMRKEAGKDGKIAYIALTYGAQINRTSINKLDIIKTQDLIDYSKEMKLAKKLLNISSSDLSKVIQVIEDSILMASIDFEKQNGREVSVAVFDGFITSGESDMASLSEYILKTTCFNVSFSQKGF